MKQTVTWNKLEPDTINGHGIQIHYTFTSFDIKEIEKVKKFCEKHIGGGLVFEPVNFEEGEEE